MTGDDFVDEKGSSEYVENCAVITPIDNFQVLGLASEDATFYHNFSTERKKKLMRKVQTNFVLELKRTNSGCIAGRSETRAYAWSRLFDLSSRQV
jgi:hypothetical protein